MRLPLAGLLAFVSLAAAAQAGDGAALQQLCTAEPDTCVGHLKASMERHRGGDADWFCPPADGDPRELRRLYLEWAAENPGDLTRPGAEAVKAMLADAFPCSD